ERQRQKLLERPEPSARPHEQKHSSHNGDDRKFKLRPQPEPEYPSNMSQYRGKHEWHEKEKGDRPGPGLRTEELRPLCPHCGDVDLKGFSIRVKELDGIIPVHAEIFTKRGREMDTIKSHADVGGYEPTNLQLKIVHE